MKDISIIENIEIKKTKKDDSMVKLSQTIKEKNKIMEDFENSDTYWKIWNKRAAKLDNNEIKKVEPVKKVMISDELINLIKSSLYPFRDQEIVTPPQYKNEVFTPANKESSILKAFEKISSQNNGNPFSLQIEENENHKHPAIYNAVYDFNKEIPSVATITELKTFLQNTFNFIMNRYIFNLKNKHEVTDNYFPEMLHILEHNSNIFAGITYLLYAEYDKQYNAENIYQNSDNLIHNKEKFEELLFYISHAFLQTEEIKMKFNDISKSSSPKKQQEFMYELVYHTAELSNLRDNYLLNFDAIASFLKANYNKSQNIIQNAQISNIYIPELSTVLSKQLNDLNLASSSPNFILENGAYSLKSYILNQERDKKRSFFFVDNERKIKERAEQSLDHFSSSNNLRRYPHKK